MAVALPTVRMRPLIATHRPTLGREELSAVAGVFESRWLGQGSRTQAFEEALRTTLSVPHVVAVSSGTAALHLALEALDLPESSGVLVPSLTFVATVQAILAARLHPVFCEVDPQTLQIDLDDCRARLDAAARDGRSIRVVLPVHFAGSCCDMAALQRLAEQADLAIVEDAAHAFGSTHHGRPLGTFGTAGCFSFDPIKNITCGEGGAVATRSAPLAARLRAARMLGISSDGWRRHSGDASWAYRVDSPGWRYHLPDLNAAIGLTQLPRLPQFKAKRQAIVAQYHAALGALEALTPVTRPCHEHCPFTYAIRVHGGRRDALMAHLRAQGIGSGVEYIPNHLQPAFAAFATPLPTTEQLFADILSLPLYPDLSDDDVAQVIAAVLAFADQGVPA